MNNVEENDVILTVSVMKELKAKIILAYSDYTITGGSSNNFFSFFHGRFWFFCLGSNNTKTQ